MSSWISVKDKLPELRKDVLIRVTHWQPLPDEPKGD